ncbi:AraC family transcriptional regulator [Haloferula chungangensis]|uniref:AraC family transcriptional regulator n=1 Tax=Haloferula chungangensis TaxID=1048331 RepID=A0ABW2LAE8_9BACT
MEETHVLGTSKVIAVKASPEERRAWLAEAPVCTQLNQMNIAHVGVMEAVPPFKVVRSYQSGTFMFACSGGEGEVLIDGRWTSIRAGEACLLPPFVENAIRAVRSQGVHGRPDPWTYAWVRYLESPEHFPIISSKSPVKGPFEAEVLVRAVQGLHAEACRRQAAPAQLQLWLKLIHNYVLSFAQPSQGDERLWRLWQVIESDLARSWTIPEMAEIAAMSREHLRRIATREIGRSPLQHVIFLRMQKASHLLATSDEKIETIAREVGYRNPFTFSTTFKKWIGRRPSEHRSASVDARSMS